MRQIIGLSLGLVLLVGGCDGNDGNVPEAGPPPISGGTLHVTADARYAVVSDPARASIFVADLASASQLHRLELTAEDEPGRIAEDAEGRVFVVLRRAGEVVTLDPRGGTITERRDVCRAPRGIDVDPDGDLVIACAEGVLVRMPATGSGLHTVKLPPDLRDVVARDGRTYVSRLRTAEILVLEGDRVVTTMRPTSISTDEDPFGRSLEPTVAWRMRGVPGGVMLVHQNSVSSQLGVLGGSSGVYYGGDCSLGVVRAVVTMFSVPAEDPSLFQSSAVAVDGASLVVDGAIEERTGRIYVSAAAETGPSTFGGRGFGFSGVRTLEPRGMSSIPTCFASGSGDQLRGGDFAATAVAPIPGGGMVVQYRDPSMLVVDHGRSPLAGGEPSTRQIALTGGPVQHFGHALFHEAAGTGATCAGCHPEGAEDGHTWLFESGTRRSQTLTGGILETAPFHWDGQVGGSTGVMEGTFVGRMGGQMPRAEEIESFSAWIDALPAMPGEPIADTGAVERGRTLFEDDAMGCASCHSGPRRTNNQSIDVGTGGRFQVPGLYELSYRPTYFHDGSADSLDAVVASHGNSTSFDDTQRADLVAFLRTL